MDHIHNLNTEILVLRNGRSTELLSSQKLKVNYYRDYY